MILADLINKRNCLIFLLHYEVGVDAKILVQLKVEDIIDKNFIVMKKIFSYSDIILFIPPYIRSFIKEYVSFCKLREHDNILLNILNGEIIKSKTLKEIIKQFDPLNKLLDDSISYRNEIIYALHFHARLLPEQIETLKVSDLVNTRTLSTYYTFRNKLLPCKYNLTDDFMNKLNNLIIENNLVEDDFLFK